MFNSANDVNVAIPVSDLNKKRKMNQIDFTGLISFLTAANSSENRQERVQSLPSDQLFWSEWAPDETFTTPVKNGGVEKDKQNKATERQKGFFCDWS